MTFLGKQLALSETSWHTQEILYPFVTDPRLPEDTLFWIIEEDYRFWPPGQDRDKADNYEEEWGEMVESRTASQKAGSSLPPSHSSSVKDEVEPTATPEKRRASRVATEYHERPTKGNSDMEEPNNGFSRDVADVVRMVTFAHRKKMGDLVWLAWCPKKKQPSRIRHGSACILLTKFAFEKIAFAAQTGALRRGHIDVQLQIWLKTKGAASDCRACYVYPPIGSYSGQVLECDPKQFGGDKTRTCGFTSGEYPCHGTRSEDEPKVGRRKGLYQWAGDGEKRAFRSLPSEWDLHTSAYWWLSYGEPTAADASSSRKDWWEDSSCATSRQKREHRAFNLRLTKRVWVPYAGKADVLVDRNWFEKCWEPAPLNEAQLHNARFHAAPVLRKL